MICPKCGGTEKLRVRETTDYGREVGRKRYCPRCLTYFMTIERFGKVVLDERETDDQ